MNVNKKLFISFLLVISFLSFYPVKAEEQSIDMTYDEILDLGKEKEEANSTDIDDVVTTTGSNQEELNQYRIVLEDDAHLLSSEEIEQLRDKMTSLTKYGHIAFKSISENSTTAPAFAEQYYHQIFQQDSGTLFLIDMDNRKIWIFSDGQNYKYITISKANSITDNIYQYASNKDYYSCAYHAFDQIQTILEGGRIAEPMRYTSIFVISVVFAFFINFLIVLSSSRIKKANKDEISKGCKIDFKIGNTNAIKTGTRRVYSPVSDSSSSGGGGGGGGGGGSSGGGGGHSF